MVRKPDFVDECYAGVNMSLLKKLTLVIPTYNRNYYLSRCLWYHAHFPFGEIIIADSSPEKIKKVNRETVAKMRKKFGVNSQYLEYEPETEKYGGDIYRKWADAVQYADSEYTQICTDKDFVLPSTLNTLISFLDTWKDYSISDGLHYHIECGDVNNKYEYRNIPSINNSSNDSWLRFIDMASNPGCTLFALHKTYLIKEVYRSLLKNKIDDLRFGEIFLELKDIILGKAMYNDEYVLIYRDTIQFEKLHGSKKSMLSSSFRYCQIWEYPAEYYQSQLNKFQKSIITNLINDNPDYTSEINSQAVDLLNLFIEKRLGKCYPVQRVKLLKKAYYYLPKKLRSIIQAVLIPDSCGIAKLNTVENLKSPELDIIINIINSYNIEWI